MTSTFIIKGFVDFLENQGFVNIRIHGSDNPPNKIIWKASNVGHVPCIVGRKEGVPCIFEVEVGNLLFTEDQLDKWRAFSSYARLRKGKLYLVVGIEEQEMLQKKLRETGILAEVLGVSDED